MFTFLEELVLAFPARQSVAADDGKGGWSDQGPTADFRAFPTGRQFFQGVPFVIDREKSCIVLATPGQFGTTTGRPGHDKMPREVTIPIGFKAEGFYFLHSYYVECQQPEDVANLILFLASDESSFITGR
jgi:hypothetical protein